jgi:hypothetical protein
MQKIESPEAALERLRECLLIAFSYSEEQRTFTLVSDYPDKSPGSDRDLVGFSFTEVEKFTREAGDLPELARFGTGYHARDEVGGRVFQAVELQAAASGARQVSFWFGPNFGGVAFDYRGLEGLRRCARVVEASGHFTYHDAVTGEELDFYDPFPQLRIA